MRLRTKKIVAVFEGTNIATFGGFWPLLPTWSDFLWFKMAGTGVPYIVLHVSSWTRISRGLLGPKSQFFSSKNSHFLLFLAKIGGSLTPEWLVKMIFFIK